MSYLHLAKVGLKSSIKTSFKGLKDSLKNLKTLSKGGAKGAKKYTSREIDEIIEGMGDSIKANPLRQEYEGAVKNLSNYEQTLRSQGLGEKEIAKAMHQARRDLGVKYKDLTPKPLRDYIYKVNKERYKGDPLGGSFEFFDAKYDGDFSKIIEGAKRPNGDVNKLLEDFRKYLEALE